MIVNKEKNRMRIKDWITKKAINYQQQQATSLTDAIDQILVKKAERLKRQGKQVSKENLLVGYKALTILGGSKELVESRIEELGLREG